MSKVFMKGNEAIAEAAVRGGCGRSVVRGCIGGRGGIRGGGLGAAGCQAAQQHHDCQNEAYEFHCVFHFHLPHFVLFAVFAIQKAVLQKAEPLRMPG